MKFECTEDILDLIGTIGNPNFSICDESWDNIYRHPKHPRSIRITDIRNESDIDITGDTTQDSREIAEALVKLLNQDYRKI